MIGQGELNAIISLGSEVIMNFILGHRQELIYTDESAEYETDREACYEKDRRRRRQLRK